MHDVNTRKSFPRTNRLDNGYIAGAEMHGKASWVNVKRVPCPRSRGHANLGERRA